MTTLAGRVDPARYRDLRATHAVLVIDFWASWCGPCRTYSPLFERVARDFRRDHPDLPVAFCAVDIDLDHAAAREVRVKAVPTTVVLVHRKGLFGRRRWRQAWRGHGVVRPNDLRAALERSVATRP